MNIDNLKKNFKYYIKQLEWYFEQEDFCSLHAKWPCNYEWNSLQKEIDSMLSFEINVLEDVFICVLQPGKNQIIICTSFYKKHLLFEFIKKLQLKVNLSNIEEEIIYLKNRSEELSKTINELKENLK